MYTDAIKKRYKVIKEIDKARKISEIDTQIFLIEPILNLAGWALLDPNVVRRSGPTKQGFDIELYKNNELAIALECKAVSSSEFNISNLGTVGGLGGDFINYPNDGIGQIRSYCYFERSHFSKNKTLAIFTNGHEWIIFKNEAFLKDLHLPVNQDAILRRATIEDENFGDAIIKHISFS